MLRTSELSYVLDESLIATRAAEPRDSARLMVVWRSEPGRVEHRRVRDLPEYVGGGDVLVRNVTRVAAARFEGVREDSGGKAEGLWLGKIAGSDDPLLCGVLLKSRRQGAGVRYRLRDRSGGLSGYVLELVSRHPDEAGGWVARVLDERAEGGGRAVDFSGVLEGYGAGVDGDDVAGEGGVGLTPLPPYILAMRRRGEVGGGGDFDDDAVDRRRYQTVYAGGVVGSGGDVDGRASVAAPTAGLHFTEELIDRLTSVSVRFADVSLAVGTGTFKPVEVDEVERHTMHKEWCVVPCSSGGLIADARGGSGGRVIAVGTTSVRTIESFRDEAALRVGGTRETDLLITPGYSFRWTDGMLTNFHLPRSTLLAMVGAFLSPYFGGDGCSVGVARLIGLYEIAMREGYRFFSYGDAMLILP